MVLTNISVPTNTTTTTVIEVSKVVPIVTNITLAQKVPVIMVEKTSTQVTTATTTLVVTKSTVVISPSVTTIVSTATEIVTQTTGQIAGVGLLALALGKLVRRSKKDEE